MWQKKVSTHDTDTMHLSTSKSFCAICYNLEKVVEELMQDMDTYANNDANDHDESDSSAEDADPTWEPDKLDREYEKTAADDDNSTQRQYVL